MDEAPVERMEALVRDPGAAPGDASAFARACGRSKAAFAADVARLYQREAFEWVEAVRADALMSALRDGATPKIARHAAGFEDAAAAEVAMHRCAGMKVAHYRELADATAFRVALPEDFRTEETFDYLARDPLGVTERLVDGCLTRALQIGGRPVLATLKPSAGRVGVELRSARRLPKRAAFGAHAAVTRMLNIRSVPAAFERRARRTPLRAIVSRRPGLRVPLCPDPFEAIVWSILGQQITVAFALQLRRTLAELCGPELDGLRAHPSPEQLAALHESELTARKFSRSKAEYVLGVARAVASGELSLDELERGPVPVAADTLLARRGIGPWSLNYVLMRGFGCGDCVLAADTGLRTALRSVFGPDEERPDPKRAAELLEPFAPHRTLACFHLWRSLNDN